MRRTERAEQHGLLLVAQQQLDARRDAAVLGGRLQQDGLAPRVAADELRERRRRVRRQLAAALRERVDEHLHAAALGDRLGVRRHRDRREHERRGVAQLGLLAEVDEPLDAAAAHHDRAHLGPRAEVRERAHRAQLDLHVRAIGAKRKQEARLG